MAKNSVKKITNISTSEAKDIEAINKQFTASENAAAAILKNLRLRLRSQRTEGDKPGAKATLKQLNKANVVYMDIIRASIKAIETSTEAKKILATFKQVNKDIKETRDEIQDLAKKLEKTAKAISALTKLIAKVAVAL
ncbi:MAG: hypothetical protein JKY94_02130 [Rhodobacteraceae bacterium]|nr:hypothetical protein [Paracoccaceae bacterium]